MSVLIIAEAGVNHNGDISLARELVDAAKESGADYVKFQTFSASALVTPAAQKAKYQIRNDGIEDSHFEMIRRLELTESMHQILLAYCKDKGIGFMSSGFDIGSLQYLQRLGSSIIKVPSGEITNLPYLRYVGGCGCDVILSTGMSSMADIDNALNVLEVSGTSRERVTVLHCSTEYPCPMEDVNLSAMRHIKSAFGVEVGYSDHTLGIEVPIAAVAMGAVVIEKHFTTDRSLPGPDHMASLVPHELKDMVHSIRNIEMALGDGIKRPSPSEVKNQPIARKSIVASRAIKAGDLFTERNITSKRPGTGISPMLWDHVVGRIAARDYSVDELIEL
jgi:N,N'-diacetyllegionaminate synthase